MIVSVEENQHILNARNRKPNGSTS